MEREEQYSRKWMGEKDAQEYPRRKPTEQQYDEDGHPVHSILIQTI